MPYCVDMSEAATLARKVFPDLSHADFEIPEQGYQNFVLLHETDVIRIARHEWAAMSMTRESSLLQVLAPTTPQPIPVFIDFIPEYHAMRITRVPGNPLSPEKLNALSQGQQQAVAEQLAGFMAFMHEEVPLSDEQRVFFQGDTGYFHGQVSSLIENRLNKSPSNKARNHLEEAKQYLEHYKTIKDDIILTHGDLISGNILYDDRTGKIGIVDFTGTSMSYRHLEFKKLLTYSASFYDAIIASYEQRTGYKVDRDLVRAAYSLNEVYNSRLEQPDPSGFKFRETLIKS